MIFKHHKGLFGVASVCVLLIALNSQSKAEVTTKALADRRAAALQGLMQDLIGPADESDTAAPVDYGAGPGVPKSTSVASTSTVQSAAVVQGTAAVAAVPVGTAAAYTSGVFGRVVSWPIIPIHVILLPDGRIMNYGTTETGAQGALLYYDIWSPSLGTGTASHLILPNTTPTDLFCSAQTMTLNGQVLITGGDLTINGQRNYARNDTNLFTPTSNSIASNTPMSFARWYGSLVQLPDGRQVVFGGIQNQAAPLTPVIPVLTPELYDPGTHAWTTLTGATDSSAFGSGSQDWYYPRVFVAPGGNLFMIAHNGMLYVMTVAGAGTITRVGTAPMGKADLPTVMFTPGKLLSIRDNQQVVVVDFTKYAPVVTTTDPIDQVRYWASGTVMADGRVFVNGGSQLKNQLTGVAYVSQIWNPATGHWTAGATAVKPRLYHSNALLLPDATVLTGGGGAPGPVKNLNAEIYYPPYLYTATGAVAARPTLSSASPTSIQPGGTLNAVVASTDVISRLTLVRTGSSTHSQNLDQRFIDLTFSQAGQNVSAVLPGDTSILVPGFYMVFAFNSAGVPSVAKIVLVS